MRFDVIYGFPVALEPSEASSEHLLQYAGANETNLLFVGVVLSSLGEIPSVLDVVAFDTVNLAIDEASDKMALFDDWLQNTAEGRLLHQAGGTAYPAVLLVTATDQV